MEAQLFESKSEKEIRLANGVQFFSEEGESKEDFIARVTEAIERDYVDTLELTEVELGSIKKKDTKTLQKARQTATGVELRMIQEILVKRGALEEPPSEGGAIYNGTLTDEDIPEEGSEEHKKGLAQGATSESGDAPKEEKKPKAKKEKAPKVEKEPKELKKQLSESEVLEALNAAEQNKGHYVTFLCTKTKSESTGIIKGVRLDKRNNFVQYRIEVAENNESGEETKAMYGKGIDSADLKIGEAAPVKEKAPEAKKEKAPATEEAPASEETPAAEEGSTETQSEE
jgi:hypothetical protein